MQNNNPQRPFKGLYLDTSPQDQPKDSYRFALNAITESEEGDMNILSNEGSNKICVTLPVDYVLLGKLYIGDNQLLIFSASLDGEASEIGIMTSGCKYKTVINDRESAEKDKLGFDIGHQIQGVYRLRLGCEKTAYFTDNLNKPRYVNLNDLDAFKNNDGTWGAALFDLQKHYERVPKFQKISVLDAGGQLPPGGYNVVVQYVDNSLNPTEWITSSNVVNIYNSFTSEEFRKIHGSINTEEDFFDYPVTSKAIKVELANLDANFEFYRLAFVQSTSGTGQITSVKYTDIIPVSKTSFIYTGDNVVGIGTETEIAAFSDIIETVQSIEQLENRLLLANTKGKQVDYCKLQKFASRITADCVTRTVNLTDIVDPSNPKNPVHQLNGRGYMPGEMYSFGIGYLFTDGSTTPVFHIPGKGPGSGENTVYLPGDKVHPMPINNTTDSTYVNNRSCGNESYWGRDFEGNTLSGKNVRHHRFPLRTEINEPLVSDDLGVPRDIKYYNLKLQLQGMLKTPIQCPESNPSCGTDISNFFEVKVDYKVDGENFNFSILVNPEFYADESGLWNLSVTQVGQYHSVNTFTNIAISISDINGTFHPLTTTGGNAVYANEHGTYFNSSGATIKTNSELFTATTQGRTYKTEMLGIKFSNIELPVLGDNDSNQIVGYYIVRNERTEFEKTILDSAVLVPSVTFKNYISHGLLFPETDKISNSVYGIIHPEHKFNNREYTQYDTMVHQGNFTLRDRKYGKVAFNDVFDGSSIDTSKQKDTGDDGSGADGTPRSDGYDGWSLEIISRDNIVSFEQKNNFIVDRQSMKENFYLDALASRAINAEANEVFNIATDNKIGIVQFGSNLNIGKGILPYVVFYRSNSDAYSNFRVLPYYKETVNPIYFNSLQTSSSISVFNGDSYVTPMRYVNTIFWDNKVAKRKGKTSAWKYIAGIVLVVLAVVLAVFSLGIGVAGSVALTAAGAALIAGGGGLLLLSSGIKQDNWNRVYTKEYDKGLRETALDNWVDTFYRYTSNVQSYFPNPWTGQVEHSAKHAKDGPSDDTIQWIGDCVTDLWFESSINMSLRVPLSTDLPSFLDAPGKIESGQNSPLDLYEFFGIYYATSNQERYPISSLEEHLARKLMMFSGERNDNKEYIGTGLGELYKINPDYVRENKQKTYNHLPLEYNCCSDCTETFPHRIHYSEQSFQEELSDNYRVFLPNNYRDIQGETGEITNIFKISNNLFIHTSEGLWQMPRNYQERVTDQIVSFIGTGSYFEIPPQKILDDDTGMSAGLQHKWGAVKTPYGYFFPSDNQRTIYQFDGSKLTPISSNGLSKWFNNNMGIVVEDKYKKETDKVFPFKDNPSNVYGSGYIATYDSEFERILFTKKDIDFLQDRVLNGDYELASCNGNLYLFEDIQFRIDAAVEAGNTYEGIVDCEMKFSRQILVEEQVVEYVWTPPVTRTYKKTFYRGYYEEGDPAHPNGGSVTYKHHVTGAIITIGFIYSSVCLEIDNMEIISAIGAGPGCEAQQTIVEVITPGFFFPVSKTIEVLKTIYFNIPGELLYADSAIDRSWTISYSLKNNSWTSWHSYIPNMYLNMPNKMYSWQFGNSNIWEHNRFSNFQTFYGVYKPYIVEYVATTFPTTTITDYITLNTQAKKYDKDSEEFYERRYVTFNKMILYNSRQCSGNMLLRSKNTSSDVVSFGTDASDYMMDQVTNFGDNIVLIDRNETDWTVNDLRDIRTNYDKPIWMTKVNLLQDDYFIDKVLNESTMDVNKDWTQLESFRDKYLVVRLIFDNFADTKLLLNYSSNNEQQSFR